MPLKGNIMTQTETLDFFASTPLLDVATMQETKSVMRDKFPKMVEYFLEDIGTYIDTISRAVAEGKMEAIIPPAHTAKSSSRQMGAMRMSAIAKAIELTAREAADANAMPTIAGLLPALEDAYARTQEAFRQVA
jgi:HPt (histidine-containing phosphotransfer) domain-containing protein